MKSGDLAVIEPLYFGYEDIARALGIGLQSAKVTASRYAGMGLLLRLKGNIYVLRTRWDQLELRERFSLANLGQTPSYISLMTALDYFGLTTQVQRGVVESVAVKRTREIALDGWLFRYTRLSGSLYFGFTKTDNFFIAQPEKALLDACYLASIGRYSLDLSALEFDRLDRNTIDRMSRKFPPRTRKLLATWIS
jgi:predicted transcriptional regulator of viral defense system